MSAKLDGKGKHWGRRGVGRAPESMIWAWQGGTALHQDEHVLLQ